MEELSDLQGFNQAKTGRYGVKTLSLIEFQILTCIDNIKASCPEHNRNVQHNRCPIHRSCYSYPATKWCQTNRHSENDVA
ncbi:hypothetical protein D3C74_407130 [compost metagenome]